MPWVYILKCADDSYYVGPAQIDLDRRIGEHQSGTYIGYTSRRRSVQLVWAAEYERFDQAIALERQIKGWSRVKKEALIAGEFERLQEKSRRRGGRPSSAG